METVRFYPQEIGSNRRMWGIVDRETGKYVLATGEQTATGSGPRWMTSLYLAAKLCAAEWNRNGEQS